MNKLLLLFFPLFLLCACSEIPPNLGLATEPEPVGPLNETVQKVLIEEFTGVRCVNCPAGSEAIEQLINIHGDRLIAISIHAGDFAFPYSDSEHDFKIEDGVSLLNFLGQPSGFPTAVVGRKVFDDETELQLSRPKWAGYIEQELGREPIIDIKLDGGIGDSGMMDVSASVSFLNPDPNEQYKFSLMITESNITDPQETPDGVMADYKHKHVLRDIITPFNGEDITGVDPIVLDFNDYVIPGDWNKSELTVIAVVHSSLGNKEVQQVEALHF